MQDKPWMRPCVYNDSVPTDSHRAEVPLESDMDPVERVPRSAGDRDSVKPQGASTDKEPLRYTPWHRRLNEVLDVDDNDELVEEPEP